MTVDMHDIRQRAHHLARTQLAREVGEMVLGDSIEDTERDWAARYALLYSTAKVYLYAFERSGSRKFARDLISEPDFKRAIEAEARRSLVDMGGAQ